MTRRNRWTALSAGLVLVVMALVVSLVPTGFVAWAPGQAVDLLTAAGQPGVVTVTTEDTANVMPSGAVLMPTMTQTAPTGSVSLVQLIAHYLLPYHDALPRDAVYPPGQSATELEAARVAQVQDQRTAATVAGLREAGVAVTEAPQVVSVRQSGPSYKRLDVGDLVLAIDGKEMTSTDDVRTTVQSKAVGAVVVVTVDRGGDTIPVTVTLGGSTSDSTVPTLGAAFALGYSFPAHVSIGLDPAAGDQSQGLALALAVYLSADSSALLAGRSVAAVGTVTPDGTVGGVDGVDEYARSAARAGAELFFMPRAACPGLSGTFRGMQIITVDTLHEVIGWLSLDSLSGAPRC